MQDRGGATGARVVAGHHGGNDYYLWLVDLYVAQVCRYAEGLTREPDFIVTIPFSFVAERFGVRIVLWLNMATRLFMCAWVLIVGEYWLNLTTRSIRF